MTSESAPRSSKKWLFTDTRSTRRRTRPGPGLRPAPQAWDEGRSSHGLVEEVGQTQMLPGRDRLVVDPLADRQIEYAHAERRENDRTVTIHRSPAGHDVGTRARHEASISRLLLGEMRGEIGRA